MTRIRVEPAELQELSRKLWGKSDALDTVRQSLDRALRRADWEGAGSSGVKNNLRDEKRKLKGLSDQAENMAGFLECKATAFTQADAHSTEALERISRFAIPIVIGWISWSSEIPRAALQLIDFDLLAEKIAQGSPAFRELLPGDIHDLGKDSTWMLSLLKKAGVIGGGLGKAVPLLGGIVNYCVDEDSVRTRAGLTAMTRMVLESEPHVFIVMLINGGVQFYGRIQERKARFLGVFLGGDWKQPFFDIEGSLPGNFDRIDLGNIMQDINHIIVDGFPLLAMVNPGFRAAQEGIKNFTWALDRSGIDFPEEVKEEIDFVRYLSRDPITYNSFVAEDGLHVVINAENLNEIWGMELENLSDLWDHAVDFVPGLIDTTQDLQKLNRMSVAGTADWLVSITTLPDPWKDTIHAQLLSYGEGGMTTVYLRAATSV